METCKEGQVDKLGFLGLAAGWLRADTTTKSDRGISGLATLEWDMSGNQCMFWSLLLDPASHAARLGPGLFLFNG